MGKNTKTDSQTRSVNRRARNVFIYKVNTVPMVTVKLSHESIFHTLSIAQTFYFCLVVFEGCQYLTLGVY